MKALIDRSQRYWSARFLRGVRPPIANSKQVVLITVSGDDRTEDGGLPLGGEMVERQLRPPLTILNGGWPPASTTSAATPAGPLSRTWIRPEKRPVS